jgi:hypothetical protein
MVLASVDLGSRGFVGPSLGGVHHSCAVYFNSTLSYDMALAACREWIQSPFTFPNGSTYALTHMEYHNQSNQAMLWSAVTLLASHDAGCSDLTDPASWRAWGGASFNVSLAANAYVDDSVVASEHVCTPLTDMTYISLLYSTFYKAHIIVGTSGGNDAAGWSFQVASGELSAAQWGPQIPIATGGFVQPGGNATHGNVEQPVPGTWARAVATPANRVVAQVSVSLPVLRAAQ